MELDSLNRKNDGGMSHRIVNQAHSNHIQRAVRSTSTEGIMQHDVLGCLSSFDFSDNGP